MPTTIATLGRERTVATLARRVYQIEGRGSSELQRRAEAALIAANPRLSSSDGFRSGGQVVVPAVPGLTRTEEEVSTATADSKGLTLETVQRLQALGSRIDDSVRRASENRKQMLKRLGDRKFVAEARTALPESAQHISRAEDRLIREEEQAAAVSERFRKAVSAAVEGVKVLDELARRIGPR
jgi:hypothetical protein